MLLGIIGWRAMVMTDGYDILGKKYKFLEALKNVPVIKKIILYGSRARGDNKERSDIDIAIDCPSATDKQWNQIIDIIGNADTLLIIDCIRFDTLSDKNPLKSVILKEGRIIYAKTEKEDI